MRKEGDAWSKHQTNRRTNGVTQLQQCRDTVSCVSTDTRRNIMTLNQKRTPHSLNSRARNPLMACTDSFVPAMSYVYLNLTSRQQLRVQPFTLPYILPINCHPYHLHPGREGVGQSTGAALSAAGVDTNMPSWWMGSATPTPPQG